MEASGLGMGGRTGGDGWPLAVSHRFRQVHPDGAKRAPDHPSQSRSGPDQSWRTLRGSRATGHASLHPCNPALRPKLARIRTTSEVDAPRLRCVSPSAVAAFPLSVTPMSAAASLESPGPSLLPPRRRVYPIRIAVAVFLLMGGGCYACLHEMTTARENAYKPREAVERGDREELRRASVFRDPAAAIHLDWRASVGERISGPPYWLAIRIEPRVPGLVVMVDEVRIQSSLGRHYAFSDTLRWPVAITMRPEYGYGFVGLQPAFNFGYAEGEKITTHIRMRMVTPSGERRVVLETEWVPVRVTRFTSIV
jgi:hypothetical protein